MSLFIRAARGGAALVIAAAVAVSAAPATPTAPAAAAQPTAVELVEVGHSTSHRQAYLRAVLGYGTGYTSALRTRLLNAGYRVCEGLTGRVPAATLVRGLRTQYGFTSSEAWKVYFAAKRHLCRS